MIRPRPGMLWWGAGLVAMTLAACSQQSGQTASAQPSVEEKTFTLTPGSSSVKVSFLTGQLVDLKVSERVERGTGKIVDPPELRGTLKLKNGSADQSARLISGKIIYVDTAGNPILLPKDRGDTSFTFSAYETSRLDPGMETSQAIDVPFPAAALKGNDIRDVRLELTFLPTPYRAETVDIPVALKG